MCKQMEDSKIVKRSGTDIKYIAVSNQNLCRRPFLEQITYICQAGNSFPKPDMLILREKDLAEEAYKKLAEEVLAICNKNNVKCILHSFLETAKELKVKKIHLPLWKLGQMAPEQLAFFDEVGCSVHSLAEALDACALGASYLTAGHIYTTDCKKGMPARGLTFLREICEAVHVPVYAIGGIHFDENQIGDVCGCGADGVCVMSEYMKAK